MRASLVGALCAALVLGTSAPADAPQRAAPPPNVLFVVWDTVRADHLSLYGYRKPTTPHLLEWAKDARVFDDCRSTAPSTIPSHASMFTGLLPTEHGANNRQKVLATDHVTLAERFRAWGYQTYLFAANPHISAELSFDQGFQVAEHPWSAKYRDEALRIVAAKVPPHDHSSELPVLLRQKKGGEQTEQRLSWLIKASGELAQRGLEEWLARRDPERPWFAFLNYMEAHRPFVAPERLRRRVMSEAEVARSYQIDRQWNTMWAFVFGLHEYSDEELAIMAASYDATLVELDELFHGLISSLQRKGLLENTIVVLTSDHGEHLGEHHLLDHQFSLYDGLLRVPLVLWDPRRVQPGREQRPVVTFDIYPTLLELAGVEDPERGRRSARSLLAPEATRVRLAESTAASDGPIELFEQKVPAFKSAPWRRTLRSLVRGEFKLIRWSDGAQELFDLASDPGEERNLATAPPEGAKDLSGQLDRAVAALVPRVAPGRTPVLSEEQRRRLEALGYIEPEPSQP